MYSKCECVFQACFGSQGQIGTVFKADPLDPARGKLYRDKILAWGGSREELDSLKVCLVYI